ncbi:MULTISPECIES: ABC transporter substrate-binding protein [unclassified Paenibacillus]|uniref:ABC transporter substrate-binding protein n=1 Tax=unclassified Paenibacillus TaxID=185978 RepID=UPI0009545925|nr:MULTISPECIES: ABC transporter substrate-binding protein [unclassified Paenibacillus]ASS66506.1 ABC transporter substrate-binding protein [Paenibacillus sp. RUD330]SIQ02338.1 multiple sugar transport system substrate-binding protein [Paenibacillus sp. RU4X]SIQ21773.1 multiple sugar transport system substrate-binding protein [Paenibacillus sp. RU4T]
MKTPKFKKASILAMTMMVPLLATACSSNGGDNAPAGEGQKSGGGKKTEILFWSPFSGSDGPFMKKIVDKYNSSQDSYKVNFVIQPNGEYYKQLDVALSTGKERPDLMIMHVDSVPTYQSKDQLQPVDELAASAGINPADFAEAPVKYATIDSKLYSIPLDIHPLVMYYNKDLFEKAGIGAPPTNRAEFDSAVEKLTDKSKGVYGYVVPSLWPQQFIFPSLVWQNGGELWNGSDVAYNSPEAVEMVQWLRGMVEKGISPGNVQQDGENTLFLQGKNAIQFNGPWMKSQFDEAGLNYGVAVVPQIGKAKQAVYAGSHGFVVPKAVTDAGKLAGIGDFLKYVAGNSLDWAESGQAVASHKVLESAEFKAMEFQSTVAQSFPSVQFAPNVLNWGTIVEPLWGELSNAILGKKSPQQAMDDAVAKSRQAIKK